MSVDAMLSARCDEIARRTRPTDLLRELLALRAADASASRALARLVGGQAVFLEGVRAGYRYVARYAAGDDSPLVWQQRMRARDTVPLGVAPAVGVAVGAGDAPDAPARMHPSGTPRDVVEFNGYRLTHALAVACDVVNVLDPALRGPALVPPWRSVFVMATYTMVLGDALRRCADDAFAGALLVGTGALLCDPDGAGASSPVDRLDFARGLAERWALPDAILEAFAPDGPDGSLSDLVRRSAAAAVRHGFDDPLGLAPPPDRAPACEPILDDYLVECGGVPLMARGIAAMMAIALIAVE